MVAVAEDQFDQLVTSAAAADNLPDVIAALPLSQVRSLASNDLLNTEIAGQVVDELGKDTFAAAQPGADQGRRQASSPCPATAGRSCWSTARTSSHAAGLEPPTTFETIERAAQTLNKDGVAGITLATTPGDSFTQQSFEYLAQANGCELVGDDEKVTLDSPQCVRAFDLYGKLARDYSVTRQPGRRLHPRDLLRRQGGDDHLVVLPARRAGRAAQRRAAELRRSARRTRRGWRRTAAS